MIQAILQKNLLRFMKERGLSMFALSKAASLNETAIRDIINGKVKSPTYNSLENIAKALNCEISDLVNDPRDEDLANITNNQLFMNSKIDQKKLAQAIDQVDKYLKEKNVRINSSDKAKDYCAWHDMCVLKTDVNTIKDDKNIENELKSLINLLK